MIMEKKGDKFYMIIDEEILKLKKQIEKNKKFFENNPELGYKEFKTSEYIIDELKHMGYEVKKNIAKTGIVATFVGKRKTPCVLFRCELDALKMDKKGRMKHSCGHDAHMAGMLALARCIMNNKNSINGTIKLLFQPAEETIGGAYNMINEGVLINPVVDYVFALHVWSELEKGTIAVTKGPVMAATDPFDIVIKGKGGHAAIPEKCNNPIYIASLIDIAIQSIVNNNINSFDNVVLGITSVNGGNSNNLIPEYIKMKGICRTYNNELREFIRKRIKEIAVGIAHTMNADVVVKNKKGNYPAVVNSDEFCDLINDIAEKIVGKKNVVTNYRTTCADDFSYFLLKKKGAYIFIGNGDCNKYPQHSEGFNVDLDTIMLGTQLMFDTIKKLCM